MHVCSRVDVGCDYVDNQLDSIILIPACACYACSLLLISYLYSGWGGLILLVEYPIMDVDLQQGVKEGCDKADNQSDLNHFDPYLCLLVVYTLPVQWIYVCSKVVSFC
jgi:hypothetical protein